MSDLNLTIDEKSILANAREDGLVPFPVGRAREADSILKTLARMEKRGLVRYDWNNTSFRAYWLTEKGRRASGAGRDSRVRTPGRVKGTTCRADARFPQRSIGKARKPVRFFCPAPDAHTVALAGDFNGWDAVSCAMERQPDGVWVVEVMLSHGHHRYRFLVDGCPVLDRKAVGIDRDDFGEKVSLLAVG